MVRPHLQQIFDDSLKAKRLAQDFSKLKKSKLKVGVMCTIAPNQLIELFGSLRARYPGVEIELTDEMSTPSISGDTITSSGKRRTPALYPASGNGAE
jgi:DNA-binding transcriptional LysR family regulator